MAHIVFTCFENRVSLRRNAARFVRKVEKFSIIIEK